MFYKRSPPYTGQSGADGARRRIRLYFQAVKRAAGGGRPGALLAPRLHFCPSMQRKLNIRIGFAAGVASALALIFAPAGSTFAQQVEEPRAQIPAQHAKAVADFEGRVKAYARLREGLEDRLPKLPKESTPEQIQAHKTAFEEMVRAARADARPGHIFTPAVATYIRMAIRREFGGRERQELRETVLEADTKGVPLRVNYTYPETKELVEMPPTLLLRLPQLPKQVRYRFVGRNLLLVDRENGLIVDFMRNAVP